MNTCSTKNSDTENDKKAISFPNRLSGLKRFMFELLCIALGVLLGSYADSLREDLQESKIAKQQARSLINDLNQDIMSLNQAIELSKSKISMADSAIKILHTEYGSWNNSDFYEAIMLVSKFLAYERTSGTYDQMKSTGSLGYFKQNLIDQMNQYDTKAKIVLSRDNFEREVLRNQWFPFQLKQFNYEAISAIRFNNKYVGELYFNTPDKNTFRECINMIVLIRNTRHRAIEQYNELLDQAKALRLDLGKKYKIQIST